MAAELQYVRATIAVEVHEPRAGVDGAAGNRHGDHGSVNIRETCFWRPDRIAVVVPIKAGIEAVMCRLLHAHRSTKSASGIKGEIEL
jgi:hypothetical protein